MATKRANPAYRNFSTPAEFGAKPMTIDDVIIKSIVCFVILLVGAVVGWAIPGLMVVGFLVGFALAMVNIFKKSVSPPLILAYAGFEGLALGGISSLMERSYPGIAAQAVLATLTVAAVTLILYRVRIVRTSPKLTKIVLIAMIGYLVFSLLNVILSLTGIITTPFGMRGMDIPGTSIPLGLVLGLLAVVMAAYCLVMDFESIEENINRGAPEKESWRGAFGLLVTLIWMYTEILRLIAIFRD